MRKDDFRERKREGGRKVRGGEEGPKGGNWNCKVMDQSKAIANSQSATCSTAQRPNHILSNDFYKDISSTVQSMHTHTTLFAYFYLLFCTLLMPIANLTTK